MKTLVIIGKRWFDKINGNTYHSVNITIDGTKEIYEPFEYGYDEMYLQTAVKLLKNNGYLEEIKHLNNYHFWQVKENLQNKYNTIISVHCIDVNRKKDL